MERNPNPLNEQDLDNYHEEQDFDYHREEQEQTRDVEDDDDDDDDDQQVSNRIYVLDEIDPHPLRCNLCPQSTFFTLNGIKAHRKKHGQFKYQCKCGFLYLTDQIREQHKSDRHPKASKQKKHPKNRKKAH